MKLCDMERCVVIIFVAVLVIYADSVNKLWNDDIFLYSDVEVRGCRVDGEMYMYLHIAF